MAACVFTSVITRGDRVTFTFTLTGSGSIAGGAATASVRVLGATTSVIADHAVTITDGPNRICTLTLTESETALLSAIAEDARRTTVHVGDIKLVLAGVTTHYGPFEFPVRTAIT
jgi:hypothetical protein